MPRGLARDHEDKRMAIRAGAASYFAEHGFGRASMAGAARACGVSKALLYHYHASKEALLFDILDMHLSRLVATVGAVAERAPEPRLRALVRAILLAYRDADAEHRLQLDALSALPPGQRSILRGHQRRLVEAMAETLAALRPNLSGDRLFAATMSVFAMLNWFFLWHRTGQGLSRESYAELVANMVLGGLPAMAD
ncbi:Putative mycofactocin biosynthesis transcriptional regulator MftR [Defluviimonas aquaemixtae]|uniref:Mycofactocin biosynthesis transcriptional regulator MftR n=1 Tax=Albidovulum aquaemixtae TaxID=1542388 RepID=A0A2R8BMK6_9RHOB|nr:TetR/AcrR family transcriptional regulator [Defluviimonas aquaemixtae]SPH24659.1 Putative mycofactocin biosynthesis transcriptional regulator MftR [Defluviimonas aquaemixtae]